MDVDMKVKCINEFVAIFDAYDDKYCQFDQLYSMIVNWVNTHKLIIRSTYDIKSLLQRINEPDEDDGEIEIVEDFVNSQTYLGLRTEMWSMYAQFQ